MNRKKNARLFKNKAGQSLVELALTLLILLTLLSGAVDYGIAFFSYISLRDAASEGALYGSICPTPATAPECAGGSIINHVLASSTTPVNLQQEFTNGNLAVNVSISGGTCAGGGITVTVIYNYRIITPLIAGNTIPLRASVTDTILRPGCP